MYGIAQVGEYTMAKMPNRLKRELLEEIVELVKENNANLLARSEQLLYKSETKSVEFI